MSAVVPQHLARGPAARPRCIPPASGSSRALNPFQSQDRIADQPLAGDFALPAPIDPFRKTMGLSCPLEPLAGLGDVPLHLHRTMHERLAVRSPPCHGDDFIETRKEAFHSCPCLGTIPSTTEPASPIGTLTNPARIGCRHRIGAEPDHRACRLPLNPARRRRRGGCPLSPNL